MHDVEACSVSEVSTLALIQVLIKEFNYTMAKRQINTNVSELNTMKSSVWYGSYHWVGQLNQVCSVFRTQKLIFFLETLDNYRIWKHPTSCLHEVVDNHLLFCNEATQEPDKIPVSEFRLGLDLVVELFIPFTDALMSLFTAIFRPPGSTPSSTELFSFRISHIKYSVS